VNVIILWNTEESRKKSSYVTELESPFQSKNGGALKLEFMLKSNLVENGVSVIIKPLIPFFLRALMFRFIS
jgi:hypothetical protein